MFCGFFHDQKTLAAGAGSTPDPVGKLTAPRPLWWWI